MKFVLIQLKECLSQKEIEEAETRARACGMPLDEWLTMVLKAAIRNPEVQPLSSAIREKRRPLGRPEAPFDS